MMPEAKEMMERMMPEASTMDNGQVKKMPEAGEDDAQTWEWSRRVSWMKKGQFCLFFIFTVDPKFSLYV